MAPLFFKDYWWKLFLTPLFLKDFWWQIFFLERDPQWMQLVQSGICMDHSGPMEFQQDSLDHCDQHCSESWHWSKIPLSADHCQSMLINAELDGIDQQWLLMIGIMINTSIVIGIDQSYGARFWAHSNPDGPMHDNPFETQMGFTWVLDGLEWASPLWSRMGFLVQNPCESLNGLAHLKPECPISTLFRKSGTILVPFLPEGYCFGAKKGRKQYPFFRGALKQYPFFRGVLFRSKKRSKTVPLWRRVPF